MTWSRGEGVTSGTDVVVRGAASSFATAVVAVVAAVVSSVGVVVAGVGVGAGAAGLDPPIKDDQESNRTPPAELDNKTLREANCDPLNALETEDLSVNRTEVPLMDPFCTCEENCAPPGVNKNALRERSV